MDRHDTTIANLKWDSPKRSLMLKDERCSHTHIRFDVDNEDKGDQVSMDDIDRFIHNNDRYIRDVEVVKV